jgi:hypothetical protein
MTTYPLHLIHNHLFLETEGRRYLIGTGSPKSFAGTPSLTVDGRTFATAPSYMQLTTSSLSQQVGVECHGLLGADILNQFDHLIDLPQGRITISSEENQMQGVGSPLSFLQGIPIVSVRIQNEPYRMFLDTGAQVSYFQSPLLDRYPSAGVVSDFFPGYGPFETHSHIVPANFAGVDFELLFGKLPITLAASLMVAKSQGVIGNAIFHQRPVGYFPRRSLLVL